MEELEKEKNRNKLKQQEQEKAKKAIIKKLIQKEIIIKKHRYLIRKKV